LLVKSQRFSGGSYVAAHANRVENTCCAHAKKKETRFFCGLAYPSVVLPPERKGFKRIEISKITALNFSRHPVC
jgi:hypothetical protein